MNGRRTLWVISGGIEARPVIERARALGLRVVVSDGSATAPGLALADLPVVANVYGPEETLDAARTLAARHGPPDGVICVHISNRYLNLAPIVSGIADRVGLQKLGWTSGGDPRSGTVVAEWIVLTDSQQMQLAFEQRAKYLVDFETEHGAIGMYEPGFAWVTDLEDAEEDFPVWTDDYSNLFRILK